MSHRVHTHTRAHTERRTKRRISDPSMFTTFTLAKIITITKTISLWLKVTDRRWSLTRCVLRTGRWVAGPSWRRSTGRGSRWDAGLFAPGSETSWTVPLSDKMFSHRLCYYLSYYYYQHHHHYHHRQQLTSRQYWLSTNLNSFRRFLTLTFLASYCKVYFFSTRVVVISCYEKHSLIKIVVLLRRGNCFGALSF